MTDTKYNGWTNYATWRVNMEMFSEYDGASNNDLDEYDLGHSLRDMAEEIIAEQSEGYAQDYALAFLNEVNWGEIAAAMIENAKEGADQ